MSNEYERLEVPRRELTLRYPDTAEALAQTQTEARPICTGRPGRPPHEPRRMHKDGGAWSGYNRRERFRCATCGRTTIVVEKDRPLPVA